MKHKSPKALWSAVLTLALSASMAPQAHAATITVDTGGHCTLADAITSANTDVETGDCPAGSGADVIDLQTDVTLVAELPPVTSVVTIAGNNHTIKGNDTFRIISNFMGSLAISDATISRGKNDFGGGLVNYTGTMTLKNCTVSGNQANIAGGGVANLSLPGRPAVLTVIDSVISGNTSDSQSGGVLNESYGGTATFNIINSTISGNTASAGGGGVLNLAYVPSAIATTNITNSTISGNAVTDGYGGGVFNYAYDALAVATVNITSSIISGNSTTKVSPTATGSGGGGVFNYASVASATATVSIVNSTISGNSTDESGGGISNNPKVTDAVTNLSVTGSTINDNTAGYYGGGIENVDYADAGVANFTVTNCTISGNSATESGGGIDTYTTNGTTTVVASTITGNTAITQGGGMYSNAPDDNARFIIKDSLVSGNKASTGGEELFNYGGTLVLSGYNLLGHNGLNAAASFEGITLSPTDVSATSDSANPFALNAIVSPLAYNGGPTQTHALPGKSPALDLAPKSECSTAPFNRDQRGSIRPYGTGCDAGAYEYKSNILLMVVPVLAAASQQ